MYPPFRKFIRQEQQSFLASLCSSDVNATKIELSSSGQKREQSTRSIPTGRLYFRWILFWYGKALSQVMPSRHVSSYRGRSSGLSKYDLMPGGVAFSAGRGTHSQWLRYSVRVEIHVLR